MQTLFDGEKEEYRESTWERIKYGLGLLWSGFWTAVGTIILIILKIIPIAVIVVLFASIGRLLYILWFRF